MVGQFRPFFLAVVVGGGAVKGRQPSRQVFPEIDCGLREEARKGGKPLQGWFLLVRSGAGARSPGNRRARALAREKPETMEGLLVPLTRRPDAADFASQVDYLAGISGPAILLRFLGGTETRKSS